MHIYIYRKLILTFTVFVIASSCNSESVENTSVENTDAAVTNNIITLGLDSLTEGAARTNFRKYLEPYWLGLFDNLELGFRFFANYSRAEHGDSFYKSGRWTEIGVSSDFSDIRVRNSMCGKGQYADDCTGSQLFSYTPTGSAWDTATLYYLIKPSGGSFTIANSSSSLTQEIDCDGVEGVGVVTINKDLSQDNRLLMNNCLGDVCFYGAWFKTTSTTGSAQMINLATGGQKTENIGGLSQNYFWFENIKPAVHILNGGMNDRFSLTKESYKSLLKKRCEDILLASSSTQIVLVVCNQSSDYENSNLSDFSKAIYEISNEIEGVKVLDIPSKFGDYDTFVENGWMADGVHPSDTFNQLYANWIVEELEIFNKN